MSDSINKMELVKKLRKGKGIQYLINEASEIFGNPILMHDLDYQAIAYTENVVTDDPFWNEFVNIGGHSRESVEILKNENLIDIAAFTKTVTVLSSKELGYDRIFGKIYNKDNMTVAAADIVSCYKPFEKADIAVFEIFCKKLSQEVSENEFYTNYGRMYLEKLITQLIEGGIEDKELYTVHIEIVYDNLENNLYLAVADISWRGLTHDNLVHFRDLFTQIRHTFKYAIYGNYIVFIMSTNSETLLEKYLLGELNKIFEQNNIYVGISSRFENLFELPTYYKEAVKALNYGLKGDRVQRIYAYDKIIQNSKEPI